MTDAQIPNAAQANPDPFYYGRRQVIRYDRTGQPSYTYLPLTAADFLDPQAGDEFVQTARHDADVRTLRAIFRHLHRFNPATGVLSHVKLIWPSAGLAQPAPDLAIVSEMGDPDRQRVVFNVREEGTAPSFVLEVVSPRLATADWEQKVAIYQQAGVQEYFIIDAGLRAGQDEQTLPTYQVLGYQWEAGVYLAITPDARGWVYSAINKVWIGPTPGCESFVVIDARTQQPITPAADREEPVAAAYAEAANRARSLAEQLDFLRL